MQSDHGKHPRGGEIVAEVGGVREVTAMPSVEIAVGEGKGGASNNIIIVIKVMEVGEEVREELHDFKVEEDAAETVGGTKGGPVWHWKPQGS